MTDEVMAELRATKEAFAAEHGHDLQKMLESLRQTERELRMAGVVFEAGPREEPPEPAKAGRDARQRHG